MQAIITKYLPATDTKGSRIKASCERGSITIPYPHELSGAACHRAAVDALLAKFALEDAKRFPGTTPPNHHLGLYVTGQTDKGYVHVPLGRNFHALEEAGAKPELLEALQIAEATLQRIAPNGTHATQGTRDVIKAAINKAIGQ